MIEQLKALETDLCNAARNALGGGHATNPEVLRAALEIANYLRLRYDPLMFEMPPFSREDVADEDDESGEDDAVSQSRLLAVVPGTGEVD